MTRYIVTGAAGHLGSTVVRVLLERNAVVRGLLLPREQPAVPGAEYIHGDVLKPESLYPLFQRVKDERLVVVHPSGIIGPYDEGRNHLVQMVRDFMENKLPTCVKGGYDLVDVRDVAAGCVAAAERGRVGECYILSGGYHEIREILGLGAVLCGKKVPPTYPCRWSGWRNLFWV